MANRDWMYERTRRGGLRVLLTRAERDLANAALSLDALGAPDVAREARRLAGEVGRLLRPTDAAVPLPPEGRA